MQITDIKSTLSLGAKNRNWSLLRIETDDGLTGYGEWIGGASKDGLKAQRIVMDPQNVNRIHHDTLWAM
tara:strand:+ start:436 stop:642 length:207 start_codon:yes stop_codon:yes gene_type:complete